MNQRIAAWIVVGCFVGGLASCATSKKKVESIEPETFEEPDIRAGEWLRSNQLATIFFDYNKSILRGDTKDALKDNAEYLKENTELEILIEGYCDERGTIEYNMVLGQKRAAVVRDYLSKLGVSSGRISTISYGEEKPSDYGHTEAAWAKNRRAEFKIRTASP